MDQQLAALLDLTRVASAITDLQTALSTALRPMAQAAGWCYGELWLPEEGGGPLRSQAYWHEDDPALAAFAQASAGLRFDSGAGLVGGVWQSRRAEWVPDVEALGSTRLVHPERAIAAGIRAGLALPILVEERAIAVLICFSREPRAESEAVLRLFTLAAAQLGAAIYRLQAQEALRAREAELAALNAELERRVAERTAQYVAANATLATSEQRYRQVVEDVTEVIFRTDAAGLWTLLNSAWTTITGFSVEESLGQNFLDYIHPDDRARNLELFTPLIAREKAYCRHEIRYRTRAGGFRWIEVFARLTFDEGGAVSGTCGTLFDITERRRTEQALRDSQQDLQNFLDNAHDLIQVVGFDLRLTYVNRSWCDTLGYSAEEAASMSLLELVLPEYQSSIRETVLQQQAGDSPSLIEIGWRAKSGRIVYVEGKVKRWERTEGPPQLYGIYRDITARRAAREQLRQAHEDLEQRVIERTAALAKANVALKQESAERAEVVRQLQASEERFRQITEHINEVFYIFDLREQRVLYVSPSFERIWGIGRARLYADLRAFMAPIHPKDRGPMLSALGRQAEGQQTEEVYRLIQQDGTVRWIRDRAYPVHNQEGELYRVVGLAEDITEQHTAEGLLQQTNAELERLLVFAHEAKAAAERSRSDIDAILNRLGEGFVALDTAWRVLYLNSRAAELLRCEAGSLGGLVLWEHVPPTIGAPLERACRRAIAQQCPVTLEQHVDASDRWFEIRVYPSEKGVSIFSQEVSERKRAEALLRQTNETLERRVMERTAALSEANSELERAARLKDEFLANMSHELRTPLNAILTLTEAMMEGVYGSLVDRQSHALEAVRESGQHLLALINDILDLTKIEAGKLELDLEPVVIDDLCAASMRMVRQSAHSKRLRMVSSVDPQVEAVVGDPRRLKQILVNLLSNAVKFTPEGGNVTLDVHADEAAEVIRFVVSDSGIGIGAESIERLFKPFVQLDSRLSRRHEGTGLGLALVARLAELHGGSVAVASEPGRGSRFTVALPWRSPEAAEAPAEPGSPGCRIGPGAEEMPDLLLVEDNELVLRTTADYLIAHGYRVHVARNGVEAVASAHEQRPALILMDIQMPVMDGLEATRRIRADPALAATPIIALTALAMVGDRERCLSAGANDYLSKPVSLSDLVARIEGLRRAAAPE